MHELEYHRGQVQIQGPESGQVKVLKPLAAYTVGHGLVVAGELGHVLTTGAVQWHEVEVDIFGVFEGSFAVVDLKGGENVRQCGHEDLSDLVAGLGQAVFAKTLVEEFAEDLLALYLGIWIESVHFNKEMKVVKI